MTSSRSYSNISSHPLGGYGRGQWPSTSGHRAPPQVMRVPGPSQYPGPTQASQFLGYPQASAGALGGPLEYATTGRGIAAGGRPRTMSVGRGSSTVGSGSGYGTVGTGSVYGSVTGTDSFYSAQPSEGSVFGKLFSPHPPLPFTPA